jgi:hypothetical protein
MQYFSGFCLQNESFLFDNYLIKTDFNVAGFSYGCIKACELALKSKTRISTLQLISPSFFDDKSDKFKNMQIKIFEKNKKLYVKTFLENSISNPKNKKLIEPYFTQGTKKRLEQLLFYKWCENNFELIKQKGIRIETFIGSDDKIISPTKAKDFFSKFGEVYFFKNKDHFLL